MANLETLELTISANAESASQGIGQLTRSLSALSSAVGKSVGGLMRLNAELKTLKGYGKLKLPSTGDISNAKAVSKGAKKKITTDYDPATNNNRSYIPAKQTAESIKADQEWYDKFRKNASADYERKRDYHKWASQRREEMKAEKEFEIKRAKELQSIQQNETKNAILAEKKAMEARGDDTKTIMEQSTNVDLLRLKQEALKMETISLASEGKLTAKQIAERSIQYQKLGEQIQKLTSASDEMKEKLPTVFDRARDSAKNLLSTVGRIFKTMLIRTAVRALIKSLTEAWNKAYEFSKKMKGSFAESIDKIKGSLQSMAINIIRAFAPMMQLVAPIISVIATGVKYLSEAIINLMKLLGIVSDMFGATAEEIIGTGDASKKATKDIIASFDELNVINSESGSSGGGGSSTNDDFLKGFKEEIDAIKMIVAESLLAVGLLLAFSGHPGIGLALAAVGAATIVGTITEKWGTMAENVKAEIVTIMAAVGGAELAIGAILAFTGVKTGLGIALMALGVANMVTAASLSWNLTDQVKEQIGNLLGIMGTGMLAIGAVLAFSGANVPLGIGMMVAGGVSLASAVALNWNTLKETIVRVFEDVSKKISAAWETVKNAVSKAWDKILDWLGIDKEQLTKTWDEIKTKLVEVWENIKTAVFNAFVNVKMWALEKWESFKTGWENIRDRLVEVWNTVKDAVFNAFVNVKLWALEKWDSFKQGWEDIKDKLAGVWNTVKEAVFNAYVQVQLWIQKKWSDLSENWEKIKTGLAGVWDHVKEKVHNAYINVVMWAQKKWSDFSSAWNDIRDKLAGVWSTVSEAVMNAYVKVVMWVQKKWSDFSSAWGKIKEGLVGVWDNVKYAVSGAWESVGKWFSARWGDISTAWESIKTSLAGIWEGVKKKVEEAWDAIRNFNPLKVLEQAWNGVIKWFTENIVNPIRRLFGMEEIQIDIEEVVLAKPEAVSQGFSDAVMDAIYKAKPLMPEIKIDEFIKITNWGELTLQNKLKYLEFLRETFGDEEAAEKVKEYGISIGQVLQYGMQSQDESIRSAAEKWADLIKEGTESNPPVITPELDNDSVEYMVSDIEWAVADGNYAVYPDVSNEELDAVTAQIEGVSATITNVTLDTSGISDKVSVEGNVYFDEETWTVIDNLSKYIKDKLGAKITVKTDKGDYITGVTVVASASGGLFNSGDMFIANENGTSEMIGRFGNQTGVANQREIIAGIQRGVSDANAEQNALLRQQNTLLQGILEKDATVRLGASAELGRVARQSLTMYSGLVGG